MENIETDVFLSRRDYRLLLLLWAEMLIDLSKALMLLDMKNSDNCKQVALHLLLKSKVINSSDSCNFSLFLADVLQCLDAETIR